MKPTQFNLGQEVLRATEAWLAANTVGVPGSIKNAAPQDTASKEEEVVAGRDTGKPATTDSRSEIPAGAAPISGPRMWTCPRCEQKMESPYSADGCRDWHCPAIRS